MTPSRASTANSSYARIAAAVKKLHSASGPSDRHVSWLDGDSTLGVARDDGGHIEIFISGPKLVCSLNTVQSHLVHDLWRGDNGNVIANRIILPAEPHFDEVAAFLCVSLLDHGVLTNCQAAFAMTEPIIGLILDNFTYRNELLIGLCGELLLLRSMISRRPDRIVDLLKSWNGHTHSARDFQIASVGVEVKTTTLPTSRHRVHGFRQIEPGHAVAGGFESSLILASIGIAPAATKQSNAWSLPTLVDGLLDLIDNNMGDSRATGPKDNLIDQVCAYGGGTAGYDHRDPARRILLGALNFSTSFARFYDMEDPAIKVLHTKDLAAFSVIDSATMEFTVELPTQVHGALNPIVGLSEGSKRIMELAWPVV